MLTDFKSAHHSTYNCLEDVLECLATGYKRAHLLMFAKAWDFNFFEKPLKGDTRLGTRVESGEYNAWESLKQYHGIGSKCVFTSNTNKQTENLKRHLQSGNPVVLWLDGYYVPWTNIYKQLHMKHFIVAVGLKDEESIAVLDPYWNKKVNALSWEAFKQSGAKCINITCLEEPNVVWQEVLSVQIEAIMSPSHNAFACMKHFAEAIKTLELTRELKGFETLPYNCPLFMQLAEVFYKRLNYAKCLNYISEVYGVNKLGQYGEEMTQIGKGWQAAREQIVDVYKGKETPEIYEKVADYICHLAEEEAQLAQRILILCE
nr:BtrH N-terminal domain-containing protein [uncultured Cellulosilyticum sp.]